ncbi:MAG: hypothetical protein ACOCXP_03045, partial [Candidatus Dojkabacteria bacterium]
TKPKSRIITPEMVSQNSCGISIRIVDARSSIANRTKEKLSAPIITRGLRIFLSLIDPPKTTGATGSTQGEKIVRTPAINANGINSISYNFCL